MSLINDALKKAQKDQSRFSSSNVGPAIPPGYTPTSNRGPKSQSAARSIIFYLIGSGLLICISVGLTLYLIKEPAQEAAPKSVASNAPIQPAKSPAPAPTVTQPTLTVQPTPPPLAIAPPQPVVTFPAPPPQPLPTLAAPVSTPQVIQIETPTPPPPIAVSPAPSTPTTPIVAAATPLAPLAPLTPTVAQSKAPIAAAPAPPPTQRIQSIVDRVQINSVRVSETETKVIINNRLYRMGDIIDHSIGLRLKEVHSNHIVFSDETGNKYIKFR